MGETGIASFSHFIYDKYHAEKVQGVLSVGGTAPNHFPNPISQYHYNNMTFLSDDASQLNPEVVFRSRNRAIAPVKNLFQKITTDAKRNLEKGHIINKLN